MIAHHSHRRRRADDRFRSRTGLTITEVVIAATMLSVLTVLGISVVMLLMTAEQRAAESVVVEKSIAEFAHELRRDSHAAIEAETADAASLTLQLPEESMVVYECVEDGVWRREKKNGDTTRQEKFHLPFGTSQFETVDDGRMIVWRHEREIPTTMSLSEPTVNTNQPRRAYRIEAAVNLRTAAIDENPPSTPESAE